MPAGYLQIPDWFSAENAGGGAAIADLDGNGKQDLVVFMVDNGPGQNRGLFRVGRDLDTAGVVTGGYTPWIDVPDWFPFENAGASVAVADVDRDEKQDIVVFMIDNPLGQNGGFTASGASWMRTAMSLAAGRVGLMCRIGFRLKIKERGSPWPT